MGKEYHEITERNPALSAEDRDLLDSVHRYARWLSRYPWPPKVRSFTPPPPPPPPPPQKQTPPPGGKGRKKGGGGEKNTTDTPPHVEKYSSLCFA
jgi:hypothetical protein